MARDINKIPASTLWFALTALIYVLQLIPFTGIFLMLVAAPYWSILTVNLGFASLVLEAGLGWISRVWLLAPIVWFGGYAAYAGMNYWAIESLDQNIRRENATQAIPFEPGTQALVVAGNASELSTAASRFVQNYAVPVAYVAPRSEPQRKSKPKSRPMELSKPAALPIAHRVAAGEACTRLAEPRVRAAHIYPIMLRRAGETKQWAKREPKPSQALCSYSLPEGIDRPAVTITASTADLPSFWLTAKVTRITLTAPDGQTADLRAGYAAPLTWFPMPVMGCALNSGAPSWDCFAGFAKQNMRGLGTEETYGNATVTVAATALGLQPSPAYDRYASIAAAGTPTLDRVLDRSERRSLDNLEAVLANPALRASVHDLNGLAEQPAVISARTDRIMQAMSAGYTAKGGLSETGRNMQRLLAALPAADFQRIGPALMDAIERGSALSANANAHKGDPVDDQLAARLSDLGPPALPLLMRLALRNNGRPNSAAIYSICRIGPPAAGFADQLAAVSSALKRNDDGFQAIYVTLLRLGRGDFADQMVPADDPEFATGGSVRISRFPALRRAITPKSPPTVCSRDFQPNRG